MKTFFTINAYYLEISSRPRQCYERYIFGGLVLHGLKSVSQAGSLNNLSEAHSTLYYKEKRSTTFKSKILL